MLPASVEYEAPTTLAEAVAALGADPEAMLIGASPRSVIDLKMRRASPSRLVDLRRIERLRGIEADGAGVRIGSMTTLRALMDGAAIHAGYAALSTAAELAGDAQLRNMETVLGCLTHDVATSGVVAALLVFDAAVTLAGPNGERTIGLGDLLTAPPTATPAGREIATAVALPAITGASAYAQVRHPATLDAVCAVAVRVEVDATGAVELCRFAVAGATHRPSRLVRAESTLNGRSLAEEAVRAAAGVASDGLDLVSDPYASGAYRAELLQVLLRRALASIAARDQTP